MSSFHVSDLHINALLSWSRIHRPILTGNTRYDLTQSEDYGRVGAILRDCNNASMDARYHDEPVGYLPKTFDVSQLSAINIVSACDCLAYQSCEYDGWETSDGKKMVDQIKDSATMLVPGYMRVWEIKKENLAGATVCERRI